MWTVLYITPSRSIAEHLRKRLTEGGVLSKLRSVGVNGGEVHNFEILVPESEVDEASELLSNALAGR